MRKQRHAKVLLIFLSLLLPCCAFIDKRPLIYAIEKPPIDEFKRLGSKDDFFLAVSVSGGGSRSAYWTACVLENLFRQVKLKDGRSIIDEIDYISSISGGSLASAYYCMKKPIVDTSLPNVEKYEKFFEDFKKDMKRNIQRETYFYPWRLHRIFYRAPERGVYLQKTFDKNYFHGEKFRELYKREKNGECPGLIINGVVMDTGAKFLFTTLKRADFNMNPVPEDEKYALTKISKSNIPLNEESLEVRLCEDYGLSIADMEISRAVVASAGVPLLFGPIVLEKQNHSKGNEEYYHISDGGVADPLGLETVIQLFLRHLEKPEKKMYRGGLVIIIDSNPHLYAEDSTNSIRGFTMTETMGRAAEIMFYRGKFLAYITTMLIQGNDKRYKNIYFVTISPHMVDDKKMLEKVKDTPTLFKITDDKADNLEKAAEMVVRDKVKDRILTNFEGRDY